MKRSPGVKRKAKQQWFDARHVPDPVFFSLDSENRPDLGNLPIPEPIHRIPRTGQGLSLRKRRKATLATVREICEHYEMKCAGKYSSKSLAARYVYDLSREVQASTKDVQEAITHRDERIEYLETCMSEWEDYFGPIRSLPLDKSWNPRVARHINTPKNVKALIDEQTSTILDLKSQIAKLEDAAKAKEKDFEAQLSDYYEVVNAEAKLKVDTITKESKKSIEAAQVSLNTLLQTRLKEVEDLKQQVLDSRENDIANQTRALEEKLIRAEQEKKQTKQLHEKLKADTKNLVDSAVEKARRKAMSQRSREVEMLEERLVVHKTTAQRLQQELDQRSDKQVAALSKDFEGRLNELSGRCSSLTVENGYLKDRVRELNRMVEAYRQAVDS